MSNAHFTILIVDDEETVREILARKLGSEGYRCLTASDGNEALAVMEQHACDLLITDLKMPGLGGMELLTQARLKYPTIEIIVMTAYGTIESAVEAMRKGAYDYLTKPIHTTEIGFHIGRALEKKHLVQKVEILEKEIRGKYKFEGIIGNSNEMVKVLKMVSQIGHTSSTVLISGESGTGKELIAKAIHFNSPRANRPYIAVNCGAVPENLQETELFGHVKGSFTGAITDKRGLLQEAHNGTLFLDEVGETSTAAQVKLLRFLQEGEIRRVGDIKPIHVDVRIIAATNRDLQEMIKEGRFREDLFYRLNVIPINLPPLRARRDDIPLLMNHFIDKYSRRMAKELSPAPQETVALMLRYDWPGNVRELENVIERAVALTQSESIQPEDLPLNIQGKKAQTTAPPMIKEATLAEIEKNYVLEVLELKDWNQKASCKTLGISKTTLWRRLKDYGIDPKVLLRSGS
jgi:DNA-binding NtrC family response regulator